MKRRQLDEDDSAVSNALRKLSQDVKAGHDLIHKVTNNSALRNLVCCRDLMKEFQRIIKDLGYAIHGLKLASSQVTVDLRERIHTVNEKMQLAEYRASKENLQIVDEIDRGLTERRQDREFANEILMSIARNLGLSQEPSNISRELANLQRDKELAAANKELLEENYLKQVIALLSRADAAYSWQASQSKYERIKTDCNNGVAPYSSFKCPLTGEVMTDPVVAADGKTYERKAIEARFAEDPDTLLHFPDTNLRSNGTLLDSINEWKEQNSVARILRAKKNLQSDMVDQQAEAFADVIRLCRESRQNKDWIAFEGLIPLIVKILQPKSCSLELKENGLTALYSLVQNNERNQLLVVDAKGVELAIICLGRQILAEATLTLLVEMMNNESARREMELNKYFFVWVATYRNGDDAKTGGLADILLTRLSDKDENIVKMAEVHWYDPLVKRLCGETKDARLKMALALSELVLNDKSIELLAEKGVVPVCVDMLRSGNLDAQLASLKALWKLSSNNQVSRCIAEAGAVQMLLLQISDSSFLDELRELASAIFENLVCKCGILYLVDTNGRQLEEEEVVRQLVGAFVHRSAFKIRLHVLKSLLELARTSTTTNMRNLIRRECHVPLQNLFNQNPEPEVRELIIRLLFYLYEEEGVNQIAPFFHAKETLKSLVQMANMGVGANIQGAAAGLIAKLAHHDRAMKTSLENVHALEALVDILKRNDVGAVDNALDALLTFSDPSDAVTQLQLASLDIFTYLKELLKSRSRVTKMRAASILRNLSTSSAHLSANSPVRGFWRLLPPCKVHLGKCEAKTTLCILKADAVPELVELLSDQEVEVAEAGLDALLTLFGKNCRCENAAEVLHDAGVMEPLSQLLNTSSLARTLLKKIREVPKVRNLYCHLQEQCIRKKLY